jgi:hypothetical protein
MMAEKPDGPLHIVFTDLPGPDAHCRFVEGRDAEGPSITANEWRRREDGYVELVVPSAGLKPEIAAEIYKASEKLCASPELLATVGADGDTLTDEAVLADLKRFNEKGTIFDEVICRAWRVVDG